LSRGQYLSPIAFHSKSPLAFYRSDGIYVLVAAAMQKTWSPSDWYFTTNPLQGIGGLELPQHNLIDPGLWLTAHLPASIGPTAAMTFYAALLAATIFWLTMQLGMAPLPTVPASRPDGVGTGSAAPASRQSGDGRNPVQRRGEKEL
jgi:hypothetical protein